jgi:hypothetical protein
MRQKFSKNHFSALLCLIFKWKLNDKAQTDPNNLTNKYIRLNLDENFI